MIPKRYFRVAWRPFVFRGRYFESESADGTAGRLRRKIVGRGNRQEHPAKLAVGRRNFAVGEQSAREGKYREYRVMTRDRRS